MTDHAPKLHCRAYICSNPNLEVRQSGAEGLGVFTAAPIRKDDEALIFFGRRIGYADEHILGLGRHVFLRDSSAYVAYYLNHSGEPNCWVDYRFSLAILRALRNIAPDEELTFNYNTSDWTLKKPFRSTQKGRPVMIRGFKYLTPGERQRLNRSQRLPRYLKRAL